MRMDQVSNPTAPDRATAETLSAIARRYGTPTYAFDVRRLRARVAELRAALPAKVDILYSLKANASLGICEVFAACGLGADVASAGEFATAIEAGRPDILEGLWNVSEPFRGGFNARTWVFLACGAVSVAPRPLRNAIWHTMPIELPGKSLDACAPSAQSRSQGRPGFWGSGIPFGDVVRNRAEGGVELSAGVKRRAAAVVENSQRTNRWIIGRSIRE